MLALLAALTASAAEVTVQVTDLRSSSGQAMFYVYCSGSGFPTKAEQACRKRTAPIVDGRSETTIPLPAGTYAITVIHDEDGDGELDTNFLGIPREGLGSSNNPRGGFGPPDFEDAKVELTDDLTLSVSLVYL